MTPLKVSSLRWPLGIALLCLTWTGSLLWAQSDWDIELRLDETVLNQYARSVQAKGSTGSGAWAGEGVRVEVSDSGVVLSGRLRLIRARKWLTLEQLSHLRQRVFKPPPSLPSRRELHPVPQPTVDVARGFTKFLRLEESQIPKVVFQEFTLPITFVTGSNRVRMDVANDSVTISEGNSVLLSIKPADYFETAIPLNSVSGEIGGGIVTPSLTDVTVSTHDNYIRIRAVVGL